MLQLSELVKRNVKIYIRDKGAVFFSLLSMLIVLMLMLFFLGDMSIEGLTDALSIFPWRDVKTDEKNAELFVMLWTCAGIVAINAPTVTLAVYSAMIKDRTEGRLGAIYSAPVGRFVICGSYVVAAWVCSVIICVITLAISEIYFIIQGGELFLPMVHLKLFGMICANSFLYASLMYLAAVLTKTVGAWSGIGTVVGTLVGFLGGIYIPIGQLSEGVANVLKVFPILYGTKAFRSVMTEELCKEMFVMDSNLPVEFQEIYLEEMGVTLEVFGSQISDLGCVCLLLGCGVVFLIAGAYATGKTMKYDR